MMDDIKVEELQQSPIDMEALLSDAPKKMPRHRPGEKFLKGPIPWNWLETAMRLPGKALHVALIIWKESGCKKSATVRFCTSWACQLGMSESTARRALRHLKEAGLIDSREISGKCLEITLNSCNQR